jgi:hypothetical protein
MKINRKPRIDFWYDIKRIHYKYVPKKVLMFLLPIPASLRKDMYIKISFSKYNHKNNKDKIYLNKTIHLKKHENK